MSKAGGKLPVMLLAFGSPSATFSFIVFIIPVCKVWETNRK
jgi:hypothetical protein